MTQGTKTPIEPSTVARLTAGLRYALTGKYPEWMSPLSPLEPVTTPDEQEGIRGRAFDFPVGFNTRVTPRQGEPVGFDEMRALADGYDLLRLVIESRKDQLAKLSWTVQPRDKTKRPDAKCREVQEFLLFPDRENNWHDWLRMLVEDMLVIDAATIYPRLTRGGKPYAFELVDGATITRKVDITGRTPLPPETAYQQVLKGVPAVNYSMDELIYAPRNKRTHKVYGYSPVEQVIMTVNIALRRQMHQLQYYSEGSTPDLIFQVPESWNPDQIRQFQVWWNGMLAGNTGARRGTMFVPNGVSPIDTKAQILKDDYDEWLARVICYAFSISPQSFVKEMNRATAETALQQALAEGLQPVMNWIKGVADSLIWKCFGYTDLEFVWSQERPLDPRVQAEIDKLYIEAGVLHPDEVRQTLGREPLQQADDADVPSANPIKEK
jgi:HK97 family phage portal protein